MQFIQYIEKHPHAPEAWSGSASTTSTFCIVAPLPQESSSCKVSKYNVFQAAEVYELTSESAEIVKEY